jgi:hypothetical protein
MTSFASREAMTTAEPPEPFASFMISVLFLSLNPLDIVGPAARHLCNLWFQKIKKFVLIRVHSWLKISG